MMSKLDINTGSALPHHTNILCVFKKLLLGEKAKLSFNLQLPRNRLIMLEVTGRSHSLRSIKECFGRNFFSPTEIQLGRNIVFPNEVLEYLSIHVFNTTQKNSVN